MQKADDYGFISALFSYPDKYPEEEVWIKLKPFFSDLIDPDKITYTALCNEYVSLFINSLPEVPCPPYSSIYTDGTLSGNTTQFLTDLYARYGYRAVENPDHIAVQFEFLEFLHTTMQSDQTAEADFNKLLGHISAWTPEFFGRVKKFDKTGFFCSAALVAELILEEN